MINSLIQICISFVLSLSVGHTTEQYYLISISTMCIFIILNQNMLPRRLKDK